jgi:hypothetical protein
MRLYKLFETIKGLVMAPDKTLAPAELKKLQKSFPANFDKTLLLKSIMGKYMELEIMNLRVVGSAP